MAKMTTKRNINIFTEKKALLTVLEHLINALDEEEKDNSHSYEIVGKEEEQATDWRTGELQWEDEEKTIPVYRNKYGYVPIPEENLTDEQYATVQAVATVRAMLEKLV